jgi:hypothetical protein
MLGLLDRATKLTSSPGERGSRTMSALARRTDVAGRERHVRKVPANKRHPTCWPVKQKPPVGGSQVRIRIRGLSTHRQLAR